MKINSISSIDSCFPSDFECLIVVMMKSVIKPFTLIKKFENVFFYIF